MTFSSPITGHAQGIALTAVSFNTAWSSVKNVKVIAFQGMTAIAMSLLCVVRTHIRFATTKVFLHRDGFHVRRIHASVNAAEVIDSQVWRDGSINRLVGPSVGTEYLPDSESAASERKAPISILVQACCPKPTAAPLVHVRPETLSYRAGVEIHCAHTNLLSHTNTEGRR